MLTNKKIKDFFKNLDAEVEIDSSRYCCNFTSFDASDAVKREDLELRKGHYTNRKRLFLKDEDCRTLTFAKAKIIKIIKENSENITFWLYQKDTDESLKQYI